MIGKPAAGNPSQSIINSGFFNQQ